MGTRLRRSLALAAAMLASAALTGCEGCAADRHARAQALDAGVVPRAVQPMAPALCYVAGREQTTLLEAQIFALCQGAPTPTGPIDCYVAALRRLTLTDAQRVALCRCAPSAAPVACFEMLEDETFLLDAQIEQLCAPTLVQGLLPSCVPRTG